MYVCLCHAVSDKDIERAVSDGAREFSELQEQLSVGTCCGCCVSYAKSCLRRCQAEDLEQLVTV